MSIQKQYLKSKPVCKVKFNIPETLGNGAENAHVVGESEVKKIEIKTG